MSLHQELPVYKASYDLLMEIFNFTKEFSKEYKYTVGESLKKETIELLTLIFRANSRTDKQQVFLLPGISYNKLPRQVSAQIIFNHQPLQTAGLAAYQG